MENKTTLSEIQAKVKAPKNQTNDFGKYKYRSCEDIVEAVKPIINPLGFWLIISDSIELVGNRFYIKATATLTNGTESYSTSAFAREEETKKGMDGAQVTGSASSYARKYALNGLFAIDDTKDSDHSNKGEESKKEEKKLPELKEGTPLYQKVVARLKEAGVIEDITKNYTVDPLVKAKLETIIIERNKA